jgi:hypothetical protein
MGLGAWWWWLVLAGLLALGVVAGIAAFLYAFSRDRNGM